MKPILLDIPDDPRQWPGWLDEQLVGLYLGDLVEQLKLINPEPAEEQPALTDVCGAELDQVLDSGLGGLSERQLRALLKFPELLLDLQERIFIDGGEYWQSVPRAQEHRRLAERQWEAIRSRIRHSSDSRGGDEPSVSKENKTKPGWGRIGLLSALAAGLLIGVITWLMRPAPPTWGFDSPGLLTAELPADQYLDSLADAAQGWFNKRLATQADLAQRLREFSHGCETLINAPHPQLAPEDRVWLIERCRAWQEEIDNHLADLQTGAKPLEQVRDDADATVNQLIDTLRARGAA